MAGRRRSRRSAPAWLAAVTAALCGAPSVVSAAQADMTPTALRPSGQRA
jgi:hypothetical protein